MPAEAIAADEKPVRLQHAAVSGLSVSIDRSGHGDARREKLRIIRTPMFESSRNSFIAGFTALSRSVHAISIVAGHDSLKRTWLTSLASLRTNRPPNRGALFFR